MTNRPTSSSKKAAASDPGAETAQAPLGDTVNEVVDRAGDLVEKGTEVGIQQADRGLQLAAEGAESLATTIRRVSGDIGADQPQIAGIANTAADQADAVARYLHGTDSRKLLGLLEERARRQPLLFMGGAFVLGAAASRLFGGRR